MKRSFDDGRTWSNLSIVADGYRQGAARVGDPAPIVKTSGEVVLVYQNVTPSVNGEGAYAYRIMAMRTDNDGATWSVPVDITASTRGVNASRPSVAVGPPGGVELRSGANRGRMVVCASGHTGDPEGPSKGSYALMSDDGGSTWSSGAVVRGCAHMLPIPRPHWRQHFPACARLVHGRRGTLASLQSVLLLSLMPLCVTPTWR